MDRKASAVLLTAWLVTFRLMTPVLSQNCVPNEQSNAGCRLVPFGATFGDDVLPMEFDDTSDEIDLPVDFIFFTKKYSSLFINSNGVVSFVSPEVDFSKDPPSFPIAGVPLIAPYWADVDTRDNDGAVYYRTIDGASGQNTDFIRDIARRFVSGQNYVPVWAVIVTWNNVTHYGGNSTSPVNTFQAVLTSDGARSYVQFAYDQILWSSHDNSSVAAQVGFNAGVGRRSFSLPLSREPAVVDIDGASNVGIPGVFVYRVDVKVTPPHACNTEEELSIWPPYGTLLGGERIHIAGPCFDNNVTVRFDGQDRPVTSINTNFASFVTPIVLRLGSAQVQLSTDGGANFALQTTFSLVDTGPGVKRLNSTFWDVATTQVSVQWDGSAIDSNTVDIYFLIFNLAYSDSDNTVPETVYVPLEVNQPNNGTAGIRLDVGLPLATDQQLVVAAFGAIAITPNGTLSSTIIYSDIHLSRWYIRLVLCETSNRGLASTVSPTVETSDNITTPATTSTTTETSLDDTRCPAIDEASFAAEVVEVAVAGCEEWAAAEEAAGTAVGDDLPSPPCTEGQAALDPAWVLDGECFTTRRPTPAGNGQRACYGENKELSSDIMSNRAQLAHPVGAVSGSGSTIVRLWKVSHFKRDQEPRAFCCLWSDNCNVFLERRPSRDCLDYEFPSVGGTFGFSHFVSYDQKEFTFNDVGEYIVSSHDPSGFNLQGRMVEVSEGSGADTKSVSRWAAFVCKTQDSDTVELRLDEGLLEILLNGDRFYTGDQTPELPLKGVSLSRKGTGIDLRYDTGNYMRVTYTADGLNLLVQAPADQGVTLKGLLGKSNTTRGTNPYLSRDGDTIPADSTLQAIRTDFGLTWRTAASESLFSYPEGSSHPDFQDTEFSPYFAPEDLQENNFCNQSFQCDFEFAITADMVTAVTSRDFQFRIRDIFNGLTEVLSRCDDRPCGNGTCVVTGTTLSCQCDDGFEGDNCEIEVEVLSRCDDRPCGNGTCVVTGTTLSCQCDAGFEGDNCEIEVEDSDNKIVLYIIGGVVPGLGVIAVIAVTIFLCRKRPNPHSFYKEDQLITNRHSAVDVPNLFTGPSIRRHNNGYGSEMFGPTRPNRDPETLPRPDRPPDRRPEHRFIPDHQGHPGPDATSGLYRPSLPSNLSERSNRSPTPVLPRRNYSTFRDPPVPPQPTSNGPMSTIHDQDGSPGFAPSAFRDHPFPPTLGSPHYAAPSMLRRLPDPPASELNPRSAHSTFRDQPILPTLDSPEHAPSTVRTQTGPPAYGDLGFTSRPTTENNVPPRTGLSDLSSYNAWSESVTRREGTGGNDNWLLSS